MMRRILPYLLSLLTLLGISACIPQGNMGGGHDDGQEVVLHNPDELDDLDFSDSEPLAPKRNETETVKVKKNGQYTDKVRVAEYIHKYGHLPDNFITKREAQDLGWESSKGNLNKVAPGMSIGGDKFGNYEGQLPKAKGRKYYECDIDYKSGRRGAKRIIYSSDGLIFYTDDHYNSFTQLY